MSRDIVCSNDTSMAGLFYKSSSRTLKLRVYFSGLRRKPSYDTLKSTFTPLNNSPSHPVLFSRNFYVSCRIRRVTVIQRPVFNPK